MRTPPSTSAQLFSTLVSPTLSRAPSSAFSTWSAPGRGGVGGSLLLVSAVLCCGGIVAYVHTSQKTAQEKMHRAVVMDKQRLKARRRAEREADRAQQADMQAADSASPSQPTHSS